MDDLKTAVLLMAYGSPNKFADIEPYYTDVRRGRPPEPQQLEELQSRYTAIGGVTPLLEITNRQAAELQKRLGLPVFVGMKHWHPLIKEAVDQIAASGAKRIVALALAPHYSVMSVADYAKRLRTAVDQTDSSIQLAVIERWGANPDFIDSICERLEATRAQFSRPDWKDIEVIFSAHSLPERILAMDDPYPLELAQTAQLVASKLKLPRWQLAFQSAGRTSDKWLGPDVLSQLRAVARSGAHQALIAPIGFVTDNLEILYDLDIEAAEVARDVHLELRRLPMPNASPRFIDALASTVKPYIDSWANPDN